MTDLTTLGLILVLTVGGQLSSFLSIARLKQWSDEIATGVVSGVPVSLRHRSMILGQALRLPLIRRYRGLAT